jgi:hypothetical protein
VFDNHIRDYGVPMLRQMLPVLTEDSDSTKWFGGFDEADTWSAGSGKQKDPTPGPSTVDPSITGPVKKQKLDSKGKGKATLLAVS